MKTRNESPLMKTQNVGLITGSTIDVTAKRNGFTIVKREPYHVMTGHHLYLKCDTTGRETQIYAWNKTEAIHRIASARSEWFYHDLTRGKITS